MSAGLIDGPARIDQGSVAQNAAEPLLAGQAARKAYRVNNSRLPDGAWDELDELMVRVAVNRLNLFERLQDAGLIDPVSLGTTISKWQETNKFDDADVDMDGRSNTDEDASVYATKGVPVPLVNKPFRVGHRELDANSTILDTNAGKATRKVLEKINDIIVNGWGQRLTDSDGNSFKIEGVTTHGDRNTHSGSSWGTDTNVESDVREMIDKAEADNYYGPYDLWLAGEQFGQLRQPSPDFDNMRLRQQIAELPEIDRIVVSDKISDGEAVLIQLTRDVMDAKLVNGTVTDAAEWSSTPMETRVKVWSGFAPRVKSDMGPDASDSSDRQSGIVHATGLS